MRHNPEQSRVDADDLVSTWVARLGSDAENYDGLRDGGTDVRLGRALSRQVGTRGFQVKSSIEHAIRFVREQIRRGICTPVVVGGPGRDIRIALAQLAEFGLFVAPGFEDTGDYDELEELAAVMKGLPLASGLRPY